MAFAVAIIESDALHADKEGAPPGTPASEDFRQSIEKIARQGTLVIVLGVSREETLEQIERSQIAKIVEPRWSVRDRNECIQEMLADQKVAPQNALYIGCLTRKVTRAREAGVTAIGFTGKCRIRDFTTPGPPFWAIESLEDAFRITSAQIHH